MPLQNRVKPTGEIVATRSNGTMMGNRGNLHNTRKELIRQTKSHYIGWVTCLLKFQGIERTQMTPGRYTEFFFLDEATAFSAGHRPCNDCQKERLKEFKEIWLGANTSEHPLASKNMKDIDGVLQEERIDSDGCKVKFLAEAVSLPDGTVVEIEEKYFLKWKNVLLEWSFDGYVCASQVQKGRLVQVLTPKSIVRCFSKGFIPKVHESAERFFS